MSRREIIQLFKRFFITFVCCVPIFLLIGFLLENKIQYWIMTVIFIVIGGGVFAIEELIYSKRKQKRELLKQELTKNKEEYFKEEPKQEKESNKTKKTKTNNVNQTNTKIDNVKNKDIKKNKSKKNKK